MFTQMTQKHENDISYLIRKAAYAIHTTLGPGLLESVYETLMCHELRKHGLDVQAQVPLPVATMDCDWKMASGWTYSWTIRW